MNNFKHYEGWELPFFDKAKNFRQYQLEILKKHIKGIVAEIGPGNGSLCEKYLDLSNKVFLFEENQRTEKSCCLFRTFIRIILGLEERRGGRKV